METNDKLVSVIVPVYNCAKLLRRCVQSIAGQTYGNLECIVVDDGSTDETPQVCAELSSLYGITVIHKANEGAEKARQSGMQNCHGEYVMFVDSDDYIEPFIVAACVERMRESVDIVCFDYALDENREGLLKIHKEHTVDATAALKYMFLKRNLDGNMVCKLYRRTVVEGVEFDARRNCDFVTVANILERTKNVIVVPVIGYHYSVIEGSQSRNRACHPREEEYEEAAYEIFCGYRDKYPEIQKEAESYWLFTLLYVCMKMEKDRGLSRTSQRFQRYKRKFRACRAQFFQNPYISMVNRIKYLLCYTNMFRALYSFLRMVRIV